MNDLIAKLEAATEGSRELDAAIWETLDEMQQWQTRVPGLHYNDGKTDDQYEPGHYTTSLDDALKLVPERLTRSVDATAPECGVDVDLHTPNRAGWFFRGTHELEPIATVIAALKAKADG